MAEKRPEQCTNPFILLVCQRLVRAGWSQHVCGAPSRPPPPGEGPGEQLGAVAKEARGAGSTVRKGRAGLRLCPRIPSLGCKQWFLGHAQGACPGIPSQAQGTCVPSVGWGDSWAFPVQDWPGSPRPRAGFIAGGRAGGPGSVAGGLLGSALRAAPGTAGTRGWEREQRTQGRMERRRAPWHRDTNARTGAGGAETRTSKRWGRGRGDEAGESLPRMRLCTRSVERGARSSRC